MPLSDITQLAQAADGERGFDCNVTLTKRVAEAFARHGYTFAIRYLRRTTQHPYDLTAAEAETIIGAGLGLMCVQHVESEQSWVPSRQKGKDNGFAAVYHAQSIGLPKGTLIWCDLEGVAKGVEPGDVIAYCNAWHTEVREAGYRTGLYVGWHCGLSPRELYTALRFTNYWAAYNLNADQYPTGRGVQMKQHVAKPGDVPPDLGMYLPFDVDTIQRDGIGDLPMLLAPSVAQKLSNT